MRYVGYIDSRFIAGSDYRQITRRDYVGAFEFDTDTLERTLLPEGFVTAADNALHIFIPDYQGNITGVYNSSANALEQFTDYYPYGLPHASATSPEVNTRKYGAKELTTDHGLNLYDFTARWQNPAFPRFTTLDPLAELKSWNSNYGFCGGDPINFIDPTGLDEFEYDKEGHLKNIVPNEDFDAIYILDDDGNRIHASEQFPVGTIVHYPNDEQTGAPEHIEVEKNNYAEKIYEFLADNTSVEWSKSYLTLVSYSSLNIISTSNQYNVESSMIEILIYKYLLGEDMFSRIESWNEHIHSHVSNNPRPSGLKNRTESSDILFAQKIYNYLGYVPSLKIYLPKYHTYIRYNRNSTFESVYYENSEFGRIYNEIINNYKN